MSSPKDGPMPHVEVDDPAAAFHKLEDFTRQILSIPKKLIDRKLASEKTKKSRKRS